MALQLASMLDTVSFSDAAVDKMTSVMNSALSQATVGKGYNVLVTIAGRSYSLTSGKDGKLTVSKVHPGAATAKAIGSCKVRWLLDPTAITDEEDEDAADKLMAMRKMQIEGDGDMLTALNGDLASIVSDVLDQAGVVKPPEKAAEKHEKALTEFKASTEEATDYTALQIAHLSKDIQDPPLMKIKGWVLFTAVSVMFGNAGQSNYTAANIVLDILGYMMRMSSFNTFDAIGLGWGTVGGLGMRWKAFASQDMMLANDQTAAMMMTWDQAIVVLRCVLAPGVCGEIIHNNHFGDGVAALTTMFRHPQPWGKGKGGGLDLSEAQEPDIEYTQVDMMGEQKTDRKKPRGLFFPGRRVTLHGLESNKEMNGLKGTLVEEVDDDKWQVKLDDHGDKILRVKNLKTLNGTSVRSSKKAVSLPPADMYNIAGTWDSFEPHDMDWDSEQGCYAFPLEVTSGGKVEFKVFKESASELVKGKAELYSIDKEGDYQVRVALSGSTIKKVDWVRTTPMPATRRLSPAEVLRQRREAEEGRYTLH